MDGLSAIPQADTRAVDSATKRVRLRRAFVTLRETLWLALDALRAHKLRSFLTLLGVILAVTTLVFVMSVIAGLNVYIVHRFGIITSEDAWIKAQKRPLVTMEEFERLRDNMKVASAVAAEEDHNVQVRSGNLTMESTRMMGATPNFAQVRNLTVAQGRFITQADEEHRSEVVFVGPELLRKFLPTLDPIGMEIRAQTHSYAVI